MSKIFEALRLAELLRAKREETKTVGTSNVGYTDRRTTSRIYVSIPLFIYGYIPSGEPFYEETSSVVVNGAGGLISMTSGVQPGQRLVVTNKGNDQTQECVVVRVDRYSSQIALRFTTPTPQFWRNLEIGARLNSGTSMSGEDIQEPRWPAFVAMLAAALLYLALPEPLSLGPRWLLLAIVFVLLIPIIAAHHRGHYNIAGGLTFIANGVITVALIASLTFLIQGLPEHREPPKTLLFSAGALWVTNILVFALWYWKLDGGGPLGRQRMRGRLEGSFLFPQMTQNVLNSSWSPHFIDYLFLAFNTSTAFSPTDTAVLSRWAKLGMMLQALISLTIIALLAARAVNIL